VIIGFYFIIHLLNELVCWVNGERRLEEKVRTIRSRRAVSPVIATVILVAVAITVAVAVAYWMGGIAGQYTQFEKVEIQSAWSEKNTVDEYWEIHLELKNTGSAPSTLNRVFVNEVPLNSTGYSSSFTPATDLNSATRIGVNFDSTGLTIKSGDSATVIIYISYASGERFGKLSSGTTINIKLHSAGGMDYIKLVELV